jgi:rRNA processing protein Gar1
MTIEALWSVEFSSNVGSIGAGVAVFETGRVLGGDSAFMYVGSYKTDNGTVHSDIHVTKYNNIGHMQSIFGPLTSFHIKVSGKTDPQSMVLTGVVVEQPQLQITIKATRRAELP